MLLLLTKSGDGSPSYLDYTIFCTKCNYVGLKAHIVYTARCNIVCAKLGTVCVKRNLVLCPQANNDVNLSVK